MLKDIHGRLRPLGITDILDETVEIFKSNFALLVGISAFFYVPYAIMAAQVRNPEMNVAKPGQVPQFHDFIPFFTTLGIAMAFYIIAAPIVTGALTFGISERYLGRGTSIRACYQRVLQGSVFLPLLGANILVFLAALAASIPTILAIAGGGAMMAMSEKMSAGVMGGGILLIIIGLVGLILPAYVWLRLMLVAPAFIIEMRGSSGSLRRSWDLMKGSLLKALAVLFIVGLVVSVIQGIIGAPLSLAMVLGASRGSEPSNLVVVLNTIVQAVLSTLLMPLSSIVVILLYYDMRIRKEGFDLELLANELDKSARQFGAQGTAALPQEQIPAQERSEDGHQQ